VAFDVEQPPVAHHRHGLGCMASALSGCQARALDRRVVDAERSGGPFVMAFKSTLAAEQLAKLRQLCPAGDGSATIYASLTME
jgi:hypothetical protein